MRYFFLTFQSIYNNAGDYKSHRMYGISLGNAHHFIGVANNQPNAFGGKVPPDLYTGNLRSATYSHLEDDADLLRRLQNDSARDLFNMQITEMTPQQRAWFKGVGGYQYMDTLLGLAYYHTRSRKTEEFIKRWRAARKQTFFPDKHKPVLTFKGRNIAEDEYKRAKKICVELAGMVRDSITLENASEVEDFFVDRGDSYEHLMQIHLIFERVKSALEDHRIDVEVTHCDCGHFERNGDTHDVRGDTWCDSCFDDNAVFVEDLQEYWPRDDAYWSENDDAYYSYDREDGDSEDPDSLMEYSTNVLNHVSPDATIKSSPHGEFLMGIEFEMVTMGRVSHAVSDVRDELGGNYCVCKYDGSLSDGGLEIVTAPRGLAEHIKRFKGWDIHSDYRAWDRKCCGMHIHIDSKAFTQMTLGKFIMFINDRNNMDFIRKIAGRHPERDEQARSYAAAEDQQVLVNPSKAVKGKSYERYRMVNLQNLSTRESRRLGFGDRFDEGRYNTVELRIFRASLKKERLLAQIEFTHAAVMFCRVASWRELNQSNFLKWLKGAAQGLYPHLSDWYGVRRRVSPCLTGKQSTCQDQPEPATEGD